MSNEVQPFLCTSSDKDVDAVCIVQFKHKGGFLNLYGLKWSIPKRPSAARQILLHMIFGITWSQE